MIFRESGLYFMLDNGRHVPSPANALLAADSAYEVNYSCIFFVNYFTIQFSFNRVSINGWLPHFLKLNLHKMSARGNSTRI